MWNGGELFPRVAVENLRGKHWAGHLSAHILGVDGTVLVVDEHDGRGGIARALQLRGVDFVDAILQLLGQHGGKLTGGRGIARAFESEHAGRAVHEVRGKRGGDVVVAVENVLVQLGRHALAGASAAERVAAAQQGGQNGEGDQVLG